MMKLMKTLAFALLAPVVIMCAFAAQTNPDTPKFSLTITTDNSEVALGTDINIGIKITNISEEPLNFIFGNRGNVAIGYQYDVRDEQGAVVAKRAVRQDPVFHLPSKLPGSTLRGVIQPGKSIGEATTISDVYQFDRPGTYTIQVSRKEPGMPLVKSNIITITVVGSQPPPPAQQ
jgi:hypothetical protein